MTALDAVAVYLPKQRVAIEDLAGQLGLTPIQVKLFRRFHGLAEIRLDPGRTLLDLLLAATARLESLHGREDQVRYVLHARSMPVVAPYPVNPLHELCGMLGLRRAVAFTVTHHACATGLLAVEVAGRLLAADGDPAALALVLAGEKTFTRDAQLVPETSIFGEAAAACLVRSDGPHDRLLAYAADIRGEFDGRMEDSPELMARYQRDYPTSLAGVMQEAAARAGGSGCAAGSGSLSAAWCWTTCHSAGMPSARTFSLTTRPLPSVACCGPAIAISSPRRAWARRFQPWSSSTSNYHRNRADGAGAEPGSAGSPRRAAPAGHRTLRTAAVPAATIAGPPGRFCPRKIGTIKISLAPPLASAPLAHETCR